MGYMTGVTKKGIDLVSRITGLLNELTAEDFEDTYVALRVSLMEEDLSREVGFWSLEYDYGDWAFFNGARSDIEARKPTNTDDLIPRLEKAVKAIEKLRDEQAWSEHEKVRLEGKREGVQLALSYAREGLKM